MVLLGSLVILQALYKKAPVVRMERNKNTICRDEHGRTSLVFFFFFAFGGVGLLLGKNLNFEFNFVPERTKSRAYKINH